MMLIGTPEKPPAELTGKPRYQWVRSKLPEGGRSGLRAAAHAIAQMRKTLHDQIADFTELKVWKRTVDGNGFNIN